MLFNLNTKSLQTNEGNNFMAMLANLQSHPTRLYALSLGLKDEMEVFLKNKKWKRKRWNESFLFHAMN